MKKIIVLLTEVAILIVFSLPAIAGNGAGWKIYGSARVRTFSVNDKAGYSYNIGNFTGYMDGDADTTWDMDAATTRLGFQVKSGNMGDHVEIRPDDASNVRRWYGTWDFGPGQILIGHTWSPLATLYSNQSWTDKGILSIGDNSHRREMVQIKLGNFKVAFEDPGTGAPDPEGLGAGGDTDNDTTLPQVEASYHLGFDALAFDFGFGFNSFDYVINKGGAAVAGNTGPEESVDIDSWYLQAGGKTDIGPAYIRAQFYLAQNFGNYGAWDEHVENEAIVDIDANGNAVVRDTNSAGYELILGYKINDSVGLEAGYGAQKSEGNRAAARPFEDISTGYYIQAKIALAKNVFLIPEFGKLDFEDYEETNAAGNNVRYSQGDRTYFGAKWQIDF